MHGYDYLSFVGQNAVFGDAELRFPLIDAALTPIGVIGGIRGVAFVNVGGAWFPNQGYKFASNAPETVRPVVGYSTGPDGSISIDPTTGLPEVKYGNPETISGLRLENSRASYGLGFETFLLGFPLHFDWAWRTLLNKAWEDYVFSGNVGSATGGSADFRKPRFDIWIGYDF
jgi:outer membrane protein assembly factor BamA